MTKIDWLHHEETTTAETISALQAQESPKPTAESAQNVPKEDLISRKAAIDALDCINGTEEVLRSLPSAQPEITRCKDCKHHHYKKDIPYCDRIEYGYGWKDNDYCSRAERRTDE